MKYPIPQNPSKPTVILNITGKMTVIGGVLLIIGIGSAYLMRMILPDSTAVPQIFYVLLGVSPASAYLILFYPLPDGRRLIDWLKHIFRFYRNNQIYYYRRIRK